MGHSPFKVIFRIAYVCELGGANQSDVYAAKIIGEIFELMDSVFVDQASKRSQ